MKPLILSFLILPSIIFANEEITPELILLTEEVKPVQILQDTSITCSAGSGSIEIDRPVTWSVTINSPHLVDIVWIGEGIEGKIKSTIQATYQNTGTQEVRIFAKYNDIEEIISCGSVEVKNPPLYVSCSPNTEEIQVGKSVTWSAKVSGGKDVPQLTWSGHSEINRETNKDISIRYDKEGTYPTDLTVTSGSLSRTVYCGTVSVSDNYIKPLSISCYANTSYSHPNEVIEWKVDTSGGNGGYKFNWRGTGPIDGQKKEVVNVKYSTLGEKYSEVEVCSKDNCVSTQCGTVQISDKSNTESVYKDIKGSCSSNKETSIVGENITWTAKINQEIPTSLFTWNGTDNLNNKRGDEQRIKYTREGIKEGSFSVRTDSGELFNFQCSNTVLVSTPIDTDSNIGILIKKILLATLLLLWVILVIQITRRKIVNKKTQSMIESFNN